MKVAVTFLAPTGESLGSAVTSRVETAVSPGVWSILRKIFADGLFPHLDPADTFAKLIGLPDSLFVPHIGSVRVVKRPL